MPFLWPHKFYNEENSFSKSFSPDSMEFSMVKPIVNRVKTFSKH